MKQEASSGASKPADAQDSQAPAAAEATAAKDPTHADEYGEAGCPICQFIEAGPCGDQHKVWVSCRTEAKEQEVDFVKHCADNFRAFFGCMLSHQDYYQPFLEATGVDVEKSQEAIDAAGKDKQQQQQQQQAHQPKQQQQQQQDGPPATGTATSGSGSSSIGNSSSAAAHSSR